MITDTINQDVQKAMKAGDEIRMSTLRMLSAALHNALIEKKREALSREEELGVVKREASRRRDAIEALRQAHGKQTSSDEKSLGEKLEKEKKELAILKEFLPEEISDEELKRAVESAIKGSGATSMKDMGRVVGAVMQQVKGRAEGKKVAEMVKAKLS